MERLKEHRTFRNQLILVTLFLLIGGLIFSCPQIVAFGIVYGLLAIWNIFSYRENKKDFEKLNKH